MPRGNHSPTGNIATLKLGSARDILVRAMRVSVLKAAMNGHSTDAECRNFLDSAPEDWPGQAPARRGLHL